MMEATRDPEQFLALIENNRGIIVRICSSYCNRKEDREDLAQEIIFQLWKSVPRYDPAQKFSTWMYRVALNVAISHYRRGRKKGPHLPLESVPLELEEPENGGPDEKSKLLDRYIHELPELDRALKLLYLEDRPYLEIAEIIGISETNVGTRINRLKAKLKNKINHKKT
jgi:RNA polymerase sigma factor (sigma-70 family)